MKRILLSFFFILCASFSFAYDVEVDGIYYNLVVKTKTAEVANGETKYSGSIVIPSSIKVDGSEYSVTSIGNYAFSYCSGLISITIPNSVTNIGENAFWGCTSITTITIPNSVTNIRDNAFSHCIALTSVTIPNSVTSIGGYAFSSCSGLVSITIPNSVTNIGDYAFRFCSNLATITIPNSITNIGWGLFSECSGLTSITIPNSVISIKGYAFQNCSRLTSIIIGSGVKSISTEAFANCKNLDEVYCHAENVPSTSSDAFKDSYVNYATLFVPEKTIATYKVTDPWSQFGTFKTVEGDDMPTTKKCAKPTIEYKNGKLIFATETEDGQVVSEVKSDDIKTSYDNEVPITATYNITAYATKSGYDDSDVATATLVWLDARLDGISTDAKEITVNTIPLLITQDAGIVTISGLQNGEKVSAFDASGKQIVTSRVIGVDTMMDLSSQQGKATIIKVGDNSLKLIIK